MTTIRNFDALNDVRNLIPSGNSIHNAGLKHQVTVTMMGLAPNLNEAYAHTPKFYADSLKAILDSGVPFDSLAFKDASGTSTPQTVYETIKMARQMLGNDKEIQFHTHDTAGSAVACNMAAIEAGANIIDLTMILPINMIAYRSQYGSVSPAAIVMPALLATTVSTIVGIFAAKWLGKIWPPR